MIRTTLGVSAGAIIIVFAMVFLWPMNGFAASCAGQMVNASWYGAESGNKTASGLYFDGSQLLAAHRTLPFHTRIRVTYRGRSVVVPVEDRGPYIAGRSLDLSKAAAAKIGLVSAGVGMVCMERLP